jgi:hypothetical protein
MADNINEWLKSGAYLPDLMRDFHDQKDLFKALHEKVSVEKHPYAGEVSWVAGQCYTIDIFLWWMAQHGYLLRRATHKRDFRDIRTSITSARETRLDQARAALTAPNGKPEERQMTKTTIDTGGPAFPLQSIGPDFAPGYSGMTLRDWFAGQALAGIAATGSSSSYEQDADEAYRYADAMLVSRNQPPDLP